MRRGELVRRARHGRIVAARYVATGLVWLPRPVWVWLPPRLRLWAVDQRMWSLPSVRSQYRSPSVMARALDALDPGGR